MSNVFITGSEGFIGKHLRANCMQAGHETEGIDTVAADWSDCIDILDPRLAEYLPSEPVIIHLAAFSTDKMCRDNPLEALDVNVAGTLNVIKAAKACHAKQFIFASTEWVYGDHVGLDKPPRWTEESTVNPEGAYSVSKLMGEQLLTMSGLPNVTILRFSIVYGTGKPEANWCAVEALADRVLRGQNVEVGSLRTARRFVHVRDLCAGIVASIGRTGHETFNMAGDRLVTLEEVLSKAANIVGRQSTVIETAPNKASIRNPDGTKAREVLGWTPKIAFADGMKEVVEWLRGRHG